MYSLSRSRPPQEYGKVIIDIVLAQRLRPGTPSATRLGNEPAHLLPYEDEIRSVEGPGAGRRGPEGTAPNRLRTPVPSHALVLRCGFELDEDQFHTPVADVLGKVRHGAAPVGVAIV